jgi:hypothetical protein
MHVLNRSQLDEPLKQCCHRTFRCVLAECVANTPQERASESLGPYCGCDSRRIPDRTHGYDPGSIYVYQQTVSYASNVKGRPNQEGTALQVQILEKMFTHPRIVSRILMKKSALQPEIINTPRGGTNNQIQVRGVINRTDTT